MNSLNTFLYQFKAHFFLFLFCYNLIFLHSHRAATLVFSPSLGQDMSPGMQRWSV